MNQPSLATQCKWLPRSNTLDLLWTRDWHGRHSWKMQCIRPTGLFGPVRAHLVKCEVSNQGRCTGSTPWWSDPYWPMVLQFGGWGSKKYQQARAQLVTEISLSGCNRGNEANTHGCNEGPSGTSSSSCDDWCGGPDRGLQTNVYATVET